NEYHTLWSLQPQSAGSVGSVVAPLASTTSVNGVAVIGVAAAQSSFGGGDAALGAARRSSTARPVTMVSQRTRDPCAMFDPPRKRRRSCVPLVRGRPVRGQAESRRPRRFVEKRVQITPFRDDFFLAKPMAKPLDRAWRLRQCPARWP